MSMFDNESFSLMMKDSQGETFIVTGKTKKIEGKYVAFQMEVNLPNMRELGYRIAVLSEGETFAETLKRLQNKINKVTQVFEQPAIILSPHLQRRCSGAWSEDKGLMEYVGDCIDSFYNLPTRR